MAGLFFNGIIINRVLIQEIEDVEVNKETNEDEENNNINKSAIFNFVANIFELDILYQHLVNYIPSPPVPFQPYIELSDIRNIPFNKFNRFQPLFSLTFFGFYSEGQDEFV